MNNFMSYQHMNNNFVQKSPHVYNPSVNSSLNNGFAIDKKNTFPTKVPLQTINIHQQHQPIKFVSGQISSPTNSNAQ